MQEVEPAALWMQMEILTLLVLGAIYMGVTSHVNMFTGKKTA